ncbi:hypothetical protein ACHAWF_001381 [Thalassiosira exigua]
MGSISNSSSIITSPGTIALLTLTSAVAISFALQRQRSLKTMSTQNESAVASSSSDPNLPNPNFIIGSFVNCRSQSLFTINLPPKDTSTPPNAMLFLVHGVAEHCCRAGYIGLYESLSEAGVDVYSFDHHGHGRSEGDPRGYVENFHDYVTDLLHYIRLCQASFTSKGDPCPPLVVMGQSSTLFFLSVVKILRFSLTTYSVFSPHRKILVSVGSLITVLSILQLGNSNVGGIILTSPALGVEMNLELKIQKFFAPVIDTFFPQANIVDAVRPEDMSRNPDAVQAYIDDPLCKKGKLVARTAIQMSRSFDVVKQRSGEITCPLLILHGTDDKCTSIKASKEFFQQVGTPISNKKFLELPGLYHELLEEPENDQLMISIVEFASSGGKQHAEIEGEEKEGLVNVLLR